MRIASFNVENLFSRAVAMNLESWADGKAVLERYVRFNKLIQNQHYTPANKREMLEILEFLGLSKSDIAPFAILRQNRMKLVKRPKGKPVEVIVNGRGDWTGWLELNTEPVNEVATQNTARVIKALNADILGVVEAEDRIALRRFNEQVLKGVGGAPYEYAMLIDGNDDRGIDVGLLTRKENEIISMRSHVDDRALNGGRVFSRDCPEYEVRLASGKSIWVLVNHLKSKGYGTADKSNKRRLEQAQRVRDIYDQLLARGIKHVAILGDLNDTPESVQLAPLLENASGLKDVSVHPNYEDDGRPGTYANGTKGSKIDYILLSPELFARVGKAAVFRKGVWGGKNGALWEIFPEMTGAHEAASDHAAIWADIDI